MDLFLYNTLTRQKEKFEPYHENEVKMYTCGPTVYWTQHIGNMFAYICADVFKRTLTFAGYHVNHVMGITDVGHLVSDDDTGEDKMEKGARNEGISAWDLAKKYTDQFFADTKSLNIIKPPITCKATDYIQEQIDAVKTLEEKGFTYKTSDGIYFDSIKDPTYGELAKLDIEGLCAGERVEMAEKKCKTDFALWKFSPKNEQRQMEWDSPWGVGFPGWHIECSSFCLSQFGEQVDIHTGGIDHIPVHHTNEIAQNKGITGHRVVKYWLHNNFLVRADGKKLSKSSGDKVFLQDYIEKGYDPLAVRYLALTAHYRTPIKFSEDLVKMAQTALERLNEKVVGLKKDAPAPTKTKETNKWLDELKTVLFDDFNTAQAMTVLRDAINDSSLSSEEKLYITYEADRVFGLDLGKEKTIEIPEKVKMMAGQRLIARQQQNWALSDIIRDQIDEAGFVIKDTANGYELKEK
ncbi:MAG: cysteine--tRNA ligase [Alphaproteobacteria bacterium]|nr:cysteine--tRNA ligase [Alphaproteobacteria bacterium]